MNVEKYYLFILQGNELNVRNMPLKPEKLFF